MATAILIIGGLVAVAWTLLAIRLIRLSRGTSFRFLGPRGTTASPTVTAVVPARNEEDQIERTIAGLRAQDYPHLTTIVVDDQSTDGTAAILERLSRDQSTTLRFLRGVERPEGWVGKTWAVHQGVAASTGEWLWFVDADMGLHPQALSTALAEAIDSGADLVSLLPGVRCESFWQGAIASSFLQLLGQLYPLDRVNDPARPEALAAGGFILVKAACYQKAGGHEAVRNAIIEDIQLARCIKAAGGRLRIRLAPGLAWTHMYGRFGQIWRGLRKNAYAGMDYMPHKYVTGALIALLLAWAPWIALFVGCLQGGDRWMLIIGAWGIAAQVAATIPILVFLRLSPVPFAFTSPLGITAYVAIASSSVWHHHRGRILWKDRTISSRTVVEPK